MSGRSPIGVRCTVGVGPGTVSAGGGDSFDEHALSRRHRAMPGAIVRMTTTIPESNLMTRTWAGAVLLGLITMAAGVVQAFRPASQSPANNSTITAVPGIRVGHYTLGERPTGCTVVLVDGDAVGGVSQRGGAPGTRETDLLNPLNLVDKVNAVVLSGGSAFGLDAASGAVRLLEERGI